MGKVTLSQADQIQEKVQLKCTSHGKTLLLSLNFTGVEVKGLVC